MNDLPDALAIAAAVRTHEKTAREVIEAALEKAERYQEQWRPFITRTPELARRQAERVDESIGRDKRLPLAGVPFAVKDLIDLAETPTTCGSKAFRNRTARKHATVVEKLLDAGAVPLGKLNMHECAFGFTGENPTFGDCKNPWNAERIPGGSSSGSAVAAALGICPLTLGSDTGGSIRLPAALCGLAGLKPTYGRVSRAGVVPLSWSLDHVGPLARTAAELAGALEVLAGSDPRDDSTSERPVPRYAQQLEKPLDGLKLGVPGPWFFEAVSPGVDRAVAAALATLVDAGAERVDVALPHLEEVLGAHRAIIFSEAGAYYRPYVEDRAELFGEEIRPLLQAGLALPAVDYLQGQRVRRRVRSAWAETFRSVDCLITPTSPVAATKFGQTTAALPGGARSLLRAYLDVTLPFNLSGHPAVSVPCGFADGLPVGMQLVGRPFAEETLLRVAHQYQQRTDWHRRKPPAVADG